MALVGQAYLIAETAHADVELHTDSPWSGGAQQRLEHVFVRSRTDRYGLTVSSRLTVVMIAPKHAYVLFCGGFTTESSVAREEHHPADMFVR